MDNKLKIYACSGIGDTNRKVPTFDYWMDNTNSLTNTQAVNSIFVKINLYLSEVENLIYLTNKEIIERLNAIDVLVVCLDAAQNYAQHYTKLQKAGNVIGGMVAEGMFNNSSLDNNERDSNLDELLNIFNSRMQKSEEYSVSPEFAEWWQTNVISRNQIGLNASERAAVENALNSPVISGIGKELDWHDNKELTKYLCDGGSYFLYTYFTPAQLNKLPSYNRRRFELKKTQQLRTYNYCKSLFVGIYGNEKDMQDVIRTGIVNRFGVQPEDVCKDVVEGRRDINSIGQLATSVIVAIIGAVATVLVGVITAICQCVAQTKSSQYAAIDKKAVQTSTPNEDDFDGLLSGGKTTTAGSSSILPVVILGGAALIYFLNR